MKNWKKKKLEKIKNYEQNKKKKIIINAFFFFSVVEAMDLTIEKSKLSSLVGGNKYKSTYASIVLGNQRYKTTPTKEKNMIWNESCTL